MVGTAKVFTTGNSQAVRLPKAFRVDTREVWITRDEHTGEITLKPKPKPKLDHDALQAFLHELRSLPASDQFVPPRQDAPQSDPLARWPAGPLVAMSLQHLLDNHIASDYLRRSSAGLEERVNQGLLQQTVAISALSRAELRLGQTGMAADDRRRSLIDHFLLQLPNLPWTHQSADRYGVLKDAHRRSGTPISEIDTQIAAHALAEGLTLVTHNTRHFDQVPGLQIEDWMAEPPAPAKTKTKTKTRRKRS